MAGRARSRLRTRILIWTFVPTAIILSAVAFTIYYAYQQVTEDLVVGRNQQLTHLSAGQLSADLNPYIGILNSLARSPELYGGDAPRRSAALRSAQNQLLVFDGGAVVLDAMGRIVAASPDRQAMVGEDWSRQSFFRQILRGGAAAYSDIIPPDSNHPAMVAVAAPILSAEGTFSGMLAGLFQVGANSTSAFYGGIVKLRLGQNGSTFLVDSAGRVIYHQDGSRIGEDFHAQPDVVQVLKGQAGYLRTRNADGVDILATFAPVPGTPWGLVTEENWAGLLAASRGYGQFLLLLLTLGILTPTLLVMLGVKRITEPVVRLTAAAKEISGGRYGQQIDIATGDELEELGQQFNHMSTQLEQSYAQLEDRVQSRTKELATLNSIAAVASHSLNLQEILTDALEKTMEALGVEAGGAYSLDGPSTLLIAHRNRSEEFVKRASPRPLKGSIVEQVGLAERPLVWAIADLPEPRLKALLQEEGMAQVICVPLMAKRKLVGALNLGTFTPREIKPEELTLLAAIGQQIGVAVENAHLYQAAEQAAILAERTRLARDLHDAVTQTLFSASLIAEVLPDVWSISEDDGRRRLEELRLLTRGALAEMRTLLVELRPNALVQIPLPDLLRQLCESLVGRARLPIEVDVDGRRKLPPDVQVALYRITQEALNNVVKHSKATQAVVTLRLQDIVRLSVADDGCGFEPGRVPPDHLGLKIMRERADSIGARIVISSEPGEGSQVTVVWTGGHDEGGQL